MYQDTSALKDILRRQSHRKQRSTQRAVDGWMSDITDFATEIQKLIVPFLYVGPAPI